MGLQVNAQKRDWAAEVSDKITIGKALFKMGDDMSWANRGVDDSSWGEIDVTKCWNDQGYPAHNNGFAWYRIHVNIPKSTTDQQNVIVVNIPKVDDADECFVNGKRIGGSGSMPTSKDGYATGVFAPERY